MIRVVNVTHHYGIRPILKDINLEIKTGEVVTVVGPNGMGKTTLLGVLAGVLWPHAGYVEIDGVRRRESVDGERELRQRIVYLPDQGWLPKMHTGREFVLAVGRLHGIDDLRLFDHCDRLLRLFDLAEQGDRWKESRFLSIDEEALKTIGLPTPPERKKSRDVSITYTNAFLVSATVGWLFFCVAFHLRILPNFDDGIMSIMALPVVSAVVIRLWIYVVGYAPPISFLGRIATGRLILPGYDVVFVAPIAAILATWLLTAAAQRMSLPSFAAAPAIASFAVWLTLVLPPSRQAWQYTGHHRIAYRFRLLLSDPNRSAKRPA